MLSIDSAPLPSLLTTPSLPFPPLPALSQLPPVQSQPDDDISTQPDRVLTKLLTLQKLGTES